MGHRHMFCTSQLSDMDSDRNWNYPHPDPRLHLENGSSMHPVENAADSGVNAMACFNISPRSNDLPLPNFSSEILNYRAAHTGTSHGPFLHPSSTSSSNRVPPTYVQHGLPCYNQLTIGGVSSTVNPQMDYGRTAFKRKTPAFSMAFDSGSTSGYYSAGSSSNRQVSSDHLQSNPMSGPQSWPRDPASRGLTYGSNNLLIPGEVSQRNVRSRHSHALHLEINPSGAHPSTNLPHHISTANIRGPTVAGQWSHTPVSLDSHRGLLSSDIGCFSHEMNRSLAGSSVTNNSMEIHGGYHSNAISSRNPSITLPTLHVPPTQGVGLGRSSYGQRTTTYRAMPSYRHMGFAGTLEDSRRAGVEAVAPSRHTRPLSIIGRSNERIGRARNIYDRFQSIADENNAGNRWVSQGIAMMDRSTFYDPRNLFDQHRDMRLDIDNMSYEELLALEERIGNVNTGLSKDTISECLTEVIYCSGQIQDDQEEGKCVICLEEYKDRESLGRLKCRHDFHFSCIQKWLQIQKVCPICKASVIEDTLKKK